MKSTFIKASNVLKGVHHPKNVDPEYDQMYTRVDQVNKLSLDLEANLKLLQSNLNGAAIALSRTSKDFDNIYSLFPNESAQYYDLGEQLRRLAGEINNATTVITGRLQNTVIAPAINAASAEAKLASLHKERENTLLQSNYSSDKLEKKTKKAKKTESLIELEQKATIDREKFNSINDLAKNEHRTVLQQLIPNYNKMTHNLLLNMQEYGRMLSDASSHVGLASHELYSIQPIEVRTQPMPVTTTYPTTVSHPIGVSTVPGTTTVITTTQFAPQQQQLPPPPTYLTQQQVQPQTQYSTQQVYSQQPYTQYATQQELFPQTQEIIKPVTSAPGATQQVQTQFDQMSISQPTQTTKTGSTQGVNYVYHQ